jgi:hypothetical protein
MTYSAFSVGSGARELELGIEAPVGLGIVAVEGECAGWGFEWQMRHAASAGRRSIARDETLMVSFL